MNGIKSICRIAIGVPLLVYAYWHNQSSHALSDKATGVEPFVLRPSVVPPAAAEKPKASGVAADQSKAAAKAESSPKARRTVQANDSEFFGIDPREVIKVADKGKQQDAVKEPKKESNSPAPPKERRRVQPFDAEFFDGDPREELKQPEKQKQLQEAIRIGEQAALLALAGGALIVWGFYPVLRVAGLWLFMPDWVRARMEAAGNSGELKEASNEKADDPVPGGCGADPGRCHRGGAEHRSREGSHQPAATGNHEGITAPPLGGCQGTGEPAAAG